MICLCLVQETLTTPVANFGSKCEISDAFIEKLYKCGLVDKALELLMSADERVLAKSDGGKRKTVKIAKLEDAIKAGSNEGHKCALIVCEGKVSNPAACSISKSHVNKR